ncbi:predicted protein [Naegleria gruberi]|uniref:Predicted protein n=1 Tax=Naegleria gruberi TaxID=5762 RepID=D2V1U8_NAEGR|nr:uncharacterized protein NAEGRDRAFT_62702 [Naegleria gruberi]EFC49224.1 predicted protein [Naegleria gruberi]|eukprot:XP_002681968.1 predicted protein [Naegleria gruberi strain NEG-M]
MILGKVFDPDFVVHSISYENGGNSNTMVNRNTVFSSILQLGGKVKQEMMTSINSGDSKGTNKEPVLPSLQYLQTNPLVTGNYKETINNREESTREIASSENSDGSLLPKFLIITHKLNPISIEDFIESLSGCIKRMYDIQKEQFQNLKQNIPHYHIIDGFTIEGVIALPEDRQSSVFVPFAGNRVHFNEDMFFRLVDGLSEGVSDDLLPSQVVTWLNNSMLPYFTDPQRKFHFFAFVQTHGHSSMLKSDTSSAFVKNQSPLNKLCTQLGFHRTSKL